MTPYIKQQGRIEAGTFTLSTRKSEKVIIENEEQIPINYRNVIPETWKPDKAAIKADIKKGVIVPGAKIEENHNLQIK